MLKPDYECTKCNKVYSAKDYKASVYCPVCGVHLWQRCFSPMPFKIDDVFKEFTALKGFEVTEGIIYNNITVWMTARKNAYDKYRKKLSPAKLDEGNKWFSDFKNYLYFKYNQSWPNLGRSVAEVLTQPEQLKRMLLFLQDNSVPVEVRIQDCLEGTAGCPRINKNLLTSLLHTFWPNKYAVWTKQTDEALKRIKRTPIITQNVGKNYLGINGVLMELAAELHTNLTTIDGFMWYISRV